MRRTWPYFIVVAVIGALAGTAIAGRPSSDDDLAVTLPTSSTAAPTDGTATASSEAGGATDTTSTSTAVADASATTDAAPAPDAAATTTVAVDTGTTLDRAQVRLVVANGDGRFNLASRNADRLYPLGYVTIDLTDVDEDVAATVLYYRPGFHDEAFVLATDLGVPNAILAELPSTPVTINDDLGDIIVVLGPDAPR